jgi:hypothetical protein
LSTPAVLITLENKNPTRNGRVENVGDAFTSKSKESARRTVQEPKTATMWGTGYLEMMHRGAKTGATYGTMDMLW